MADEKLVARLMNEGVEAWNRWREEDRGSDIDLSGAKLRGAELAGVNLQVADLQCADLRDAKLQGSLLQGAGLVRADLRKADLEDADLEEANLVGANLEEASLWKASFKRAVVVQANLQRAKLFGSNFRDARLIGANLQSSQLQGADFVGAVLWKANLEDANLEGANLESANLEGAQLKQARLRSTLLLDVNLGGVEGLVEVQHSGPSSVDQKTLAKSRGEIPEVFLRGCGFQDWEIEAANLHAQDLSWKQVTDIGYRVIDLKSESPIRINPLFISYSREDSRFVEALEHRFDEKRIRYWRDVHDSTAGPLEEQIDQAIRVNPTFLLVLSKSSVESDWVRMEVEKARRLARELRRRGEERHVLCPVTLDRAWETAPWPERLMLQIKDYNILDLSGWKDDEVLGEMFGRLLEGLGIYYRQSE